MYYGTEADAVSGKIQLDTAPTGVGEERIDLIIINSNTLSEPPTHFVDKITGEASATTVDKPNIDLKNQVELSFKLLLQNETEPDEVDFNIIYDENIEWTNTELSVGGTLTDTDPYSGAVNVSLQKSSNNDQALVGWEKVTPVVKDTSTSIMFAVKMDTQWSDIGELEVRLTLGSGLNKQVMTTLTLNKKSIGKYGYNHTKIGNYYVVQLPITYFQDWSRSFTEFDGIQFYGRNLGKFELDLIQLQGGLNPNDKSGSLVDAEVETPVGIKDSGDLVVLDNIQGRFTNMETPNATAVYTVSSSSKLGAWQKTLINSATQPFVTGATKIAGSDFTPNVDMYLVIRNNGIRNEWYFELIGTGI